MKQVKDENLLKSTHLITWISIATSITEILQLYIDTAGKPDLEKLQQSQASLESLVLMFFNLEKTKFLNTFKLTTFELLVLAFCLSAEFEPEISYLCTVIQGNEIPYPTPNLAFKLLPQPSWSAFNADSPLLRWQLLYFQESQSLSLSTLRIDCSIFFYILGENYVDPHLEGLIKSCSSDSNSSPNTFPRKNCYGNEFLLESKICLYFPTNYSTSRQKFICSPSSYSLSLPAK